MATNITQLTVTTSAKLVIDTDADSTSEANVNSGAATIYWIYIDNRNNPTTTVFLKLYNATAPTIGTTTPDVTIPCSGGSIVKCVIPLGDAFGTGLSFACVTDGGGTAGTTSPTNDVTVKMVIV